MDPPENLVASDRHGIEIKKLLDSIAAKQAANSEMLKAIAIKQAQDSEVLNKNSEMLNKNSEMLRAIAIKQAQDSETLNTMAINVSILLQEFAELKAQLISEKEGQEEKTEAKAIAANVDAENVENEKAAGACDDAKAPPVPFLQKEAGLLPTPSSSSPSASANSTTASGSDLDPASLVSWFKERPKSSNMPEHLQVTMGKEELEEYTSGVKRDLKKLLSTAKTAEERKKALEVFTRHGTQVVKDLEDSIKTSMATQAKDGETKTKEEPPKKRSGKGGRVRLR